MFAYYGNGLFFRRVAENYTPATGEALFETPPTVDQLKATFPEYTAAAAISARKPLIMAAQNALVQSDGVFIRCGKAQPPVDFPPAWTTYCAALRAIVNGSDTTTQVLPTAPSYPEGT